MTNSALQSRLWQMSRQRRQYHQFRASFGHGGTPTTGMETKIWYEKKLLPPECSCAVKGCQHLTILSIFENEKKSFWNKTNPEAVQHPYWARLKSYGRDSVAILKKIRGYRHLYYDLKNNGLNLKKWKDRPVFLVDMSWVDYFETLNEEKIIKEFTGMKMKKWNPTHPFESWSKLYFRHDGHHRTDIMRFLGRKILVKIAHVEIN